MDDECKESTVNVELATGGVLADFMEADEHLRDLCDC